MPAEQLRPQIARRRAQWKELKGRLDPARAMPTLSPGDVVIQDKFSSHKNAAIRRAIRGVGARLLFLLPYSLDLNPIAPRPSI